jgi:uncharacterized protein
MEPDHIKKGESDIMILMASMEAILHPGEYVFIHSPSIPAMTPAELVMIFAEKEGYTLILEKSIADRLGLVYFFIASWISLMVHSSLEAVGFTAAFSQALAEASIPCNIVAGFYHDHIFVPFHESSRAMAVLEELARRAGKTHG